MDNRSPDQIFDAFVADGNQVSGPRPRIVGRFDISWAGGGSSVRFGENVDLHSVKLAFSEGGGAISIGDTVTIKGRLEVGGGGTIRIGPGTFFNRGCDVRGSEGASVDIGARCLFSNIKIMTSDLHSIIDLGSGLRTNPAAGIVIEDDVWLAEDVKIAKGVRVGQGSVIASGSLVTRSVPPFCVAGGRPAKVLRSGVKWTRALQKMPALPAPEFQASDVVLEKETLRVMFAKQQFALVEEIIVAAARPLPLFARWYLVFARHKLGRDNPDALRTLDQIIVEAPAHSAARKLRDVLKALTPKRR